MSSEEENEKLILLILIITTIFAIGYIIYVLKWAAIISFLLIADLIIQARALDLITRRPDESEYYVNEGNVDYVNIVIYNSHQGEYQQHGNIDEAIAYILLSIFIVFLTLMILILNIKYFI